MKRFLLSLTVLLLALCTGCGNASGAKDHTPANVGEGKDAILTSENSGAGENEADQMPGDEAFDPESENHVLLTVEAPLADGRILTLEVVGKRVDEVFESYGVYEVRVYDGDMLIQTVFTAEGNVENERDNFSDQSLWDYCSEEYLEYLEQFLSDIGEELSADEIDSLPEDMKYTACWSIEDTIEILDLNFNGNADFGLFGWVPNNNIPYYYWAWDEEEEQYCYIGTMQGVRLHPEEGELSSEYRLNADSWGSDYYRPDENGDLWMDRREIVWSPMDLMESRVSDSGPMQEVWVPREGEKFSPRSVPAYWKDSFVLIQREILVKEVYDDGDASYFWEIWELEGGELKLTSREPYVF
ncbi:MAG: hypothetical protein HDR15_06095 [Lachnospiraceae bacterium]|nr:hypothetical protein [Lachnospiraceae bacterium]